jgi:hypothetical protein
MVKPRIIEDGCTRTGNSSGIGFALLAEIPGTPCGVIGCNQFDPKRFQISIALRQCLGM